MSKVIVVGGGLSGLSAAHTLYDRGANVLVLDKNPLSVVIIISSIHFLFISLPDWLFCLLLRGFLKYVLATALESVILVIKS